MGIRDSDWVPEKYLERMNMEYMMHEDELHKPEKTHRRLLREALPYVTMELRQLALNDPDPRIRLQATTLILDRTMGKAGTTTTMEDLPGDKLYEELEKGIEKLLATRGKAD